MISPWMIVAQAGSGLGWESLREAFRTGGDARTLGSFALGLLAVILLTVGLVYVLCRPRTPREASLNALKEVSRMLYLSGQARRDIELVAARAGVRQPVSILLSPANLSAAVRRGCKGLDDPSLVTRLNDLSVKLFGAALATTEPTGGSSER